MHETAMSEGDNNTTRPPRSLSEDKVKTAPIPREGGPTIAPATKRSPKREGHHGRVAYNVFNMRLTERQVVDLKRLRDKTGITVQAHIRRAIIDYLHQLQREQPGLFVKQEHPDAA